jgi:hypothetical protein
MAPSGRMRTNLSLRNPSAVYSSTFMMIPRLPDDSLSSSYMQES